MRRNLWLAWALTLCFVGSQQPLPGQAPSMDTRPNNVKNVLAAMVFCKHGDMVGALGLEMTKLGDEVSASILRGMAPTDLASPENIKSYLCLVRLAFWKPERIVRPEDRVPGVTIFMLEYLKEREIHNEDLKAEINSVEDYVKQQTEEHPRTS